MLQEAPVCFESKYHYVVLFEKLREGATTTKPLCPQAPVT